MTFRLFPHTDTPKSTFFPNSSFSDSEMNKGALGGAQRRSQQAPKASSTLMIENGKLRIRIAIENIVFVKAEHVYVNINFVNEQRILQRGSLSKLLALLPKDQFIQVHRSYVINLNCVENWSNTHLIIAGKEIPISRSRRQEVLAILINREKGTLR